MASKRKNPTLLIGLTGMGLFVSVVAVMLWRAQQKPVGPVPIVWDKEACAHCHMHIGEPGFAAQAQLADGQVLSFDDPGCLMSWLDGRPRAGADAPRAVYFHHHDRDEWLTLESAGFIATDPTPMGFGFAAVERTRPAAVDWQTAWAQVKTRSAAGGRP